MGKALIIAEKPSVASDIARALGGFKKQADFFENDEFVLSSAVGHLLELIEPEKSQVKRGKWTFPNLPVIPDEFDLRPIEKSEPRLKLLTKLIQRKDVDRLVNACDAGREGELIFRYIVRHTGAAKPIQRLWLQSMTPASIREGFAHLRSDGEMLPLADAAVCRSEADWLVGINGTRAMTAFNSKTGGFHLTTVGRVQTPTLAIVVEREAKIKAFQSRDYWELHATFLAGQGEYTGRWFDEGFDRKSKADDADLRPERLWEKARAEAVRDRCAGRPGVVTEESKPTTQAPPLLYDLTSLQREANSRFGFSASTTLKLAQGLYERHKVLTYPRTDSRALPEDYPATVRKTLETLAGNGYGPFARAITENNWVNPGNKRVFNNSKISDHFAIIPTTEEPRKLNELEEKIYDMVVKRFLAVFHPAAEFRVTTRITRVEGEPFRTDGKVMVKAGWLAVYGKEAQDDKDAANLTPVQPDEIVQTREIEVREAVTKPPPRYTEATLLGAMEGAGKLVSDEEMREAMAEKGLGTPATRASIIEGLIYERYMLREGKELVPTAKAFSLITLLNGLGVPELTQPELTGNWEFKLNEIQRGHLRREAFMAQIADLTRHIVERAKGYEHDTIPGDFGELKTPCPKCGGVVKETYKKFQCSAPGCDFALWKIVAGRQFEAPEMEELLSKRTVGPLQGFRSKLGRTFAAVVRLTDELKAEFDFGNGNGNGNGTGDEAVDFSGQEPLGKCPKCQANVFEHTSTYVCEKAVGPAKNCTFRSGKLILQQPVAREQMQKLLADGKTGLLDGFVSKKGRKFKAFLVVDPEGKVGFEFEKKENRPARGKKAAEPEVKLDFTGQEPVGKCPRCGGRVFVSDTHYVCERTQDEGRKCKFRSGRQICQREIAPAEFATLITKGRTPLLEKFISRFGKPFAAHLVLDDQQKVSFEFPDK